jgi:7-carboxy-7-deazaguanine synthase
MPLLVNELFYSIQGESSFNGFPCTFIRLAGCNLRCAYCDTVYAYEEGVLMEIPDLLEKVSFNGSILAEITGGEPLIQEETPELIRCLIKKGLTVLLETNGTIDIGKIDSKCIKIMDIKCPSSKEHHKTDWNNISRVGQNDQVKFVISDRKDYDFAVTILPRIRDRIDHGNILFSPTYGILPPRQLAEWILNDRLHVRLNLQLHKWIWPDKERGV